MKNTFFYNKIQGVKRKSIIIKMKDKILLRGF